MTITPKGDEPMMVSAVYASYLLEEKQREIWKLEHKLSVYRWLSIVLVLAAIVGMLMGCAKPYQPPGAGLYKIEGL